MTLSLRSSVGRWLQSAGIAIGSIVLAASVGFSQLNDVSRETLLQQMESSDLDERRDAVYELVRRRDVDAAVIRALAGAIDERDQQVQFQALMGLARAGSDAKAAIPELLAVLGDRSDQIRYRAAVALGAIGKDSVEPLRRHWPSASSAERVQIARAYGLIGSNAAVAVEDLNAALSDDDAALRVQAAMALVNISSNTDLWLSLAGHTDAAVRNVGTAALAKIDAPDERVKKKLLDALTDDDARVRETAILATAKSELAPMAKAPAIGRALVDEEYSVRAAAVAAIKKADLKNEAFAALIGQRLEQVQDPAIAESLALALASLGEQGAPGQSALLDAAVRLQLDPELIAQTTSVFGQEALVALLKMTESQPEIEPFVSRSLSMAGETSSSALLSAFESPLPVMRNAVASALATLRPLSLDLVERLVAACADDDGGVRATALTSMSKILGAEDVSDELLTVLRDAAKEEAASALNDSDGRVRAAFVGSLNTLGLSREREEEVLLAALADSENQVRVAALRALASAPEFFVAQLETVAQSAEDPDEDVRAAVFEVLGKIGPDVIQEAANGEELLERGLKDKNARVRIVTTQSIQELKLASEGIVAAMEANLASDEALLMASLEALKACGEKATNASKTVGNLINHDNEAVRKLAIETLADIHDSPSQLAAQLTTALDDASWSVRQTAANSLSDLGEAAVDSVPKLFQLLSDPEDEDFASAAIRAIDAAPESGLTLFLDHLAADDFRTRFYAAFLLGKIGPPAESALPKLEEQLANIEDGRRAEFTRRVFRQAIDSIKGIESDDDN